MLFWGGYRQIEDAVLFICQYHLKKYLDREITEAWRPHEVSPPCGTEIIRLELGDYNKHLDGGQFVLGQSLLTENYRAPVEIMQIESYADGFAPVMI